MVSDHCAGLKIFVIDLGFGNRLDMMMSITFKSILYLLSSKINIFNCIVIVFSHVEKKMATHSNMFVWEIPGIEEPGRLQSKGSHRVEHDLGTKQQTKTNLDE